MLEKIRKVEKIFKKLNKETTKFSSKSNLKCLQNCNLCCMKKGLEANVLEFLPLAYYLVKNNIHESALNLLDTEPEYCINLGENRDGGACKLYEYRGLICRLFGFSGIRDKNGKLVIYTCSLIKGTQPDEFRLASENINSGMHIPVSANFYSQFYYIDSQMASDYNPINVSIRKAIEKVAYYYANKPIRKPRKKAELNIEDELL